MHEVLARTSEDILCLPTSTGEEVVWDAAGEASSL